MITKGNKKGNNFHIAHIDKDRANENTSRGRARGISLKLQRFLLTVARRYGIETIMVGAIIVVNGKRIVIDPSDALPAKEIGKRDMEETLRELVEGTGISNFSIKDYVGGFIYSDQTGTLVKQYNFLIETDHAPPRLRKDFRYGNLRGAEKPIPEFLNENDAKMLALVMERISRTKKISDE